MALGSKKRDYKTSDRLIEARIRVFLDLKKSGMPAEEAMMYVKAGHADKLVRAKVEELKAKRHRSKEKRDGKNN